MAGHIRWWLAALVRNCRRLLRLDPEHWLLYNRERRERERLHAQRMRVLTIAICIVTLALIALIHKPF